MFGKIGLFVFLCCPLISLSQETAVTGFYYGKNLYVMNPSVDSNSFCVKTVMVNGKPFPVEVRSNTFEINLSGRNFEIGDSVEVVLIHSDSCAPIFVNAQVINPRNIFTYVYAKIDREGALAWKIKGDAGEEPFEIEHFRWNRWVTIDEKDVSDTLPDGEYQYAIKLHSGNNIFRISQTDPSGNVNASKEIKFRSYTRELTLASQKVSDILEFSGDTDYEIYDEKGSFVLEGYGKQVNVQELTKGKYFVNYDNKTETFIKK